MYGDQPAIFFGYFRVGQTEFYIFECLHADIFQSPCNRVNRISFFECDKPNFEFSNVCMRIFFSHPATGWPMSCSVCAQKYAYLFSTQNEFYGDQSEIVLPRVAASAISPIEEVERCSSCVAQNFRGF